MVVYCLVFKEFIYHPRKKYRSGLRGMQIHPEHICSRKLLPVVFARSAVATATATQPDLTSPKLLARTTWGLSRVGERDVQHVSARLSVSFSFTPWYVSTCWSLERENEVHYSGNFVAQSRPGAERRYTERLVRRFEGRNVLESGDRRSGLPRFGNVIIYYLLRTRLKRRRIAISYSVFLFIYVRDIQRKYACEGYHGYVIFHKVNRFIFSYN